MSAVPTWGQLLEHRDARAAKGLAVASHGLAPAAPPAPPAHRFGMHVKVTVEGGAVHEYDGLFGHTFDAYDDALDRFPAAARIEVKTLPPTRHPAGL